MTLRLLDSTVPVDPAEARAAGYSGILRYLPNGVNSATALSSAEVARYSAADFGIGSLWELAADAAAGGEAAGVRDAQRATSAALALGQPKGTAIYAATDTDPAGLPGGAPTDVAYYRGFAAVRQAGYLAGAYTGAAAANAALAAGVIDRVMLPAASSWADGATPHRVDLAQQVQQVTIGGNAYDVDLDEGAAGLWTLHGPWPAPVVSPVPVTPQEVIAMWIVPVTGGEGRYLVGVPADDASPPWAVPITDASDETAWQGLGAKPAPAGVSLSQDALTALTKG